MALCRFFSLSFFCVVFSFIIICDGATVQFFAEHDFEGGVIQVPSFPNCQQTPFSITKSLHWSVKSTGCIVMFFRNDCTVQSNAIDNIVRNEIKRHQGVRKSFRDCTDLERGPQVNLDYDGVQFRDICGCTNLPFSNSNSKQINTYGNGFTFYSNPNCGGEATAAPNSLRYIHERVSSMRSVIPHEMPSHCSLKFNFTAKILKVEPLSNTSSLKTTNPPISIPTKKTFTNNHPNGSLYQLVTVNTELQLSGALHQMSSIQIVDNVEFNIVENSSLPAIKTLESWIKNSLASSLTSHEQSSSIESINIPMEFKEQYLVPPCTIYELTPLATVLEKDEIDYRIHLSIAGKRGDINVRSGDIRKHLTGFENFSDEDDYTVIAETTGKLRGHLGKTIAGTSMPNPACLKPRFTLTAHIVKIEIIDKFPKLEEATQTIVMTGNKQIFLNDGTTAQVENYEFEKQILSNVQFVFAEELSKVNSITFAEDVQVPFEPSVTFVTPALAELNRALPLAHHNKPYKFTVQGNQTLQLQERVSVGPCSKKEISPYLKLPDDLEVEYRVTMKVTGNFGSQQVEAGVIQENLEGLTVLSNQDNFTVVAETTAKLKLNFGLSSGLTVIDNPIPECRSPVVKLSAKIVDLERVPFAINVTDSLEMIAIGPKQIYINNGTTHQEENYEASKEIMETAEIVFANDFSLITTMTVDEELKKELEKTIPFLGSVWIKFVEGIVRSRPTLNETTIFHVGSSKEFRVQKIVDVAPCTRYDVGSFIELAENAEVSYRTLLEITGEMEGKPVPADEIRGHLKHATFQRNKNDFTAIAETTMKLKLNYGASSGVNADGKQLLDCLAAQAEIVGNCKFMCA